MMVVLMREGDSLRLSDRGLSLDRIIQEGVGLLKLDDGTKVQIAWDRWVYVLPSVRVSVSRKRGYAERLRLMVEAPPSISITRHRNDDEPDCQ